MVAVVGGGDDDEVEVRVGGDFVDGDDFDVGDVSVDGFGAAGADDGEIEAGDGTDEWGVVDLADPAITDETDADVFCGGRHGVLEERADWSFWLHFRADEGMVGFVFRVWEG